ncbi:MAG: Rne/Rng family ribonuclease [Acetobacteraceae bacterium]
MQKRMLIDTTHAEETRVVVMDGDRLEDYDVETSTRKQIKGNIYLAKVIRIEPSLQAAFVDYGGNRHGFLAFSEIHPDYFQIPVADREELLALQNADIEDQPEITETPVEESLSDGAETDEAEDDGEDQPPPEVVGGENDTGDESNSARRMARFLRNYRIQEVIRRRQIILVQVVKEERGNKGAALTTYVSLPGRYCVLMPNALRGGGVSRKITSENDRRRLRDIIAELDLPRSMAMIVRTAGAQRPEAEITRDCEYLLQLWDHIRDRTLSSIAPSLVYEEANLIKRAIRDLFSKDITEILVDGEPGWKSARDFMRNLMPHNAQLVKLWRNNGQSLFARNRVEGHLDAIFSPTATLKSGGYIVINQTEALVSIDVNSGCSTGQRNIEDTALHTNLEAAEEVARQLRLRDLAGLVVIDFIDMESRRHNAMVEKRLKEALKSDRARIQIGQISHFGLLEMSRQRLRASIAEAVLTPCSHCKGTGYIRGTESAALQVLRTIDEEGLRQRASEISVHVSSDVALYILNQKRQWLGEIEQRHAMSVKFVADDTLFAADMRIERMRTQEAPTQHREAAPAPRGPVKREDDLHEDVASHQDDANSASEASSGAGDGENVETGRRRRRGGRRNEEFSDASPASDVGAEDHAERHEVEESAPHRGPRVVRQIEITEPQEVAARQKQQVASHARRGDDHGDHWRSRPTPADPFAGASFDIFDMIEESPVIMDVSSAVQEAEITPPPAPVSSEKPEGRRNPRRGLRRGRGRRSDTPSPVTEVIDATSPAITAPQDAPSNHVAISDHAAEPDAPSEATPRPAPRRRMTRRVKNAEAEPDVAVQGDEAPAKPRPRRRASTRKADAAPTGQKKEQAVAEAPAANDSDAKPAPRRKGWWSR